MHWAFLHKYKASKTSFSLFKHVLKALALRLVSWSYINPKLPSSPPVSNFNTYSGEFVAVDDVEDLAIEGDVHPKVNVLPVPVVTLVVLGQPLPLDQLACGMDRWKNICEHIMGVITDNRSVVVNIAYKVSLNKKKSLNLILCVIMTFFYTRQIELFCEWRKCANRNSS